MFGNECVQLADLETTVDHLALAAVMESIVGENVTVKKMKSAIK